MAADRVSLLVDGIDYTGWKAVKIVRGLERFPSSFMLEVSEHYPAGRDNSALIYLSPQAACEIRLGDDKILTGYIDEYAPSISAREHTVSIMGRSRCCDLIDCSVEARGRKQQFTGETFGSLCRYLAEPYGIEVKTRNGDGPVIPVVMVPFGDSPFNVADLYSRFAQQIIYDDVDGNLVLSQVGTEKHAGRIAEGHQVEQAMGRYTVANRFREYVALLQSVDSMADLSRGGSGNLKTVVTDTTIERRRVRNIISEQTVNDQLLCEQRAKWEQARRIGRSQTVVVTVDSWRDDAGRLWEPNWLVNIDLPSLRLNDRLWIIAEVEYCRDLSGTRANLTLMPPEAFSPEPSTINAFYSDDQQDLQRAQDRISTERSRAATRAQQGGPGQ